MRKLRFFTRLQKIYIKSLYPPVYKHDKICPSYNLWKIIMLIIDVRTPDEFAEGHLKGAILIEYQHILQEIFKHITSKEDEIGLYCAAGVRSEFATYVLEQNGFTNAVNLGGYHDILHRHPELADQ